MSEPLRASAPEPGVLLLELNRADRHNALDIALVEQLQQQITGIEDRARAVVLASATAGKFCAGADLERAQVSDGLYVLLERMLTAPVPIIAAIDGPTVGGGMQLCLGNDVRLGSAPARFKFVGLGHGLAVGTWALPATAGRRGMELLLGQRFLDAEQAAELGVPDARTEALQLARSTAATEPNAVRRAKEQLMRGNELLERLAAECAGNGAVFTGSVPRE